MGAMHGFGEVEADGAVFHEDWEPRAFALTRITRSAGLTAGHFREMIEAMPPQAYLEATYYERWLYGLERRLERAGTLRPGELDEAVARLAEAEPARRDDPALAAQLREEQREGGPLPAAASPRFRPGDAVRVRRMRPVRHTRCPRYVRGARGVIERVHGDDLLADAAARGEDGPVEAQYAVRFRSDDLFGRGDEPPYRVLVDLSESYLEEAS